MATASDPLTSTLMNWANRAAQAQKAGIDPSNFRQLAQHDIHNVLAGGAPMPNNEVSAAVLSAANKKPVIDNPQRSTSPGSIIGNIAPNTLELIRGLNPFTLLPALGHNIIQGATHPAQMNPIDTSPGTFTGDVAASLRKASQAPVVGLIPGVYTAANLTTSSGRKELERNPVSTALDVLPVATKVAEVAAGASAAETGSAREAFQQGKVVRGAVRGVADLAPGDLRGKFNTVLDNLGVSQPIREGIARPSAQITRRMRNDAFRYYKENIAPVTKGLSDEELANITRKAQTYNINDPTVTPEQHALLTHFRNLSDQLADAGIAQDKLARIVLPNQAEAVYSTDSPVIESYRKANFWSDQAQRSLDKLNGVKAKVTDRMDTLAARSGKIRRFGELESDFAARADGPLTINALRDANVPFVESFRDLNPRDVYPEFKNAVLDGSMGTRGANQLAADFAKLEGDTGLVAKFDDALKAGDMRTASKTGTEISRTLRHSGFQRFGTGKNLLDHINTIRSELVGLKIKEQRFTAADDRLQTAVDQHAKQQLRYNSRSKFAANQTQRYLGTLINHPPATLQPMIEDAMRQGAIARAQQIIPMAQLDEVTKNFETTPRMSDIKDALGPEEFGKLWQSNVQTWMTLIDEGYAPIWTHSVAPEKFSRILQPKPLTDRYFEPTQTRDATFNFAPAATNIAASMTDAAVQFIQQQGTAQFVQDFILTPYAKNIAQLEGEYRTAILNGENNAAGTTIHNRRPISPYESVGTRVQAEVAKSWTKIKPEQFGLGGFANTTATDELYIPKHVDRALRQLANDNLKFPMKGAYDKVMHAYKFSILTGPRHLAHVALGGMLFMTLREPMGIFELRNAARAIREGTAPVELTQGLYNLRDADHVFQVAAGKTMARMFAESVGDKVNAYARFEERIGQIYRVADYMSQTRHGVLPEEALHMAYKTFVDLDGMAPVERIIIKNVFPFYAFTRHLFRYLLTYPVDHPIRAAVLSRFARQEQQEWQNGLPYKFQQVFFLGQPDKNGNVKSIDVKAFNPFRSFANNLTLAGFVSSLNPIATAIGSAAGINILSATPELYTDVTYDADRGVLTSKRKDVPQKIIGAFIPEYNALDTIVGMSDRARQLKASNPDAYQKFILSSLNMPFITSTDIRKGFIGTTNVPYEMNKAEVARFQAAEKAVSTARKGNSQAALNSFNVVPYGGSLVPSAAVGADINKVKDMLASRGLSSVAPSAVTPKPNLKPKKGTRTTKAATTQPITGGK